MDEWKFRRRFKRKRLNLDIPSLYTATE